MSWWYRAYAIPTTYSINIPLESLVSHFAIGSCVLAHSEVQERFTTSRPHESAKILNIDELEGRVQLDAAGLVALADLKTIQNRTALTGSASAFDLLFLAPGIHCQQDAEEVNGGERPRTGMLCRGVGGGYYVFNIENQATVYWLQRIAEPGKLVEVYVTPGRRNHFARSEIVPTFLYSLGCGGTITIVALLGATHDFWGMGVLLMLAVARVINVVVIRRRAQAGWKGAVNKDDHETDLLVLLNKDGWVRMRGVSNDVKAIVAGCWLREMTSVERYATSFATVLVYASAALAGNATTAGSLMIACLLLISAGLLGVANSYTENLHMFGRVASVVGEAKAYKRRLDMVKELVVETGSSEWAYNMELMPRPTEAGKAASASVPPTDTPSCRISNDEKSSTETVEVQEPKLEV